MIHGYPAIYKNKNQMQNCIVSPLTFASHDVLRNPAPLGGCQAPASKEVVPGYVSGLSAAEASLEVPWGTRKRGEGYSYGPKKTLLNESVTPAAKVILKYVSSHCWGL